MIDGIDFNETFAGVPDLNIVKLILAFCTVNDWELEGSDALTAFLQTRVDIPILVQVPDWYLNPSADFDPKKFSYHMMQQCIPVSLKRFECSTNLFVVLSHRPRWCNVLIALVFSQATNVS